MKSPQHLFLFTAAPIVATSAYTLHHQQRHPSFAVHNTHPYPQQRSGSSSSKSLYRTDVDPSTLDVLTSSITNSISTISNKIASTRMKQEETTHSSESSSSSPSSLLPALTQTLRQAEAEHGMPWKNSVDPKAYADDDDDLLYMKFWEWQMDFMEDNLTDLQIVSCTNEDGTDFSHNINKEKKARIVNVCATSKEYRKIRMTYYDAGDNTQVFNAVWYPDPEYNLPVLGIDLLAFNRKKYLAIVDFQPIHDEEKDHSSSYEHLLKPIKEKYDSLKGRMSSKFYDETQHFSEQMLFARFDDEDIVSRDLFPAFKSYVKTHFNLIRSTERKPEDVDMVLSKIKAYDTYSAERDPATGLFAAMYGKEWAEDFVHDFLFSMSDRAEEGAAPPANPFMGGGGGGNPHAGGGGNPHAAQQQGGGNPHAPQQQQKRP
jgi:15,16-dihydrobiliverdin:ferredoxin oxidoreductase